MSLIKQQERFSSGSKLALAILVNLLVPALGNLLMIGRTAGNFICMFICLFVWSGHDWRVTLAWTLFMDIRAYIDIYITPAHIERTRAAELAAGKRTGTDSAASEGAIETYRAVSLPESKLDLHDSDHIGDRAHLHSKQGQAASAEHDYAHGSEHQHLFGSHTAAEHEPSHGAPQPLNSSPKAAEQPQLHGNPQPLNAAHATVENARLHGSAQPIAPIHATGEQALSHGAEQALSHGAPQPIHVEHSTAEHALSHGAAQPIRAAHATSEQALSHGAAQPIRAAHVTGEQALSHGAAQPIRAAHSTGEQALSHGAAQPIRPAHSTGEQALPHGAPQPIRAAHATAEHALSHGAPEPIHEEHTTGEHLLEQVALHPSGSAQSTSEQHSLLQPGSHPPVSAQSTTEQHSPLQPGSHLPGNTHSTGEHRSLLQPGSHPPVSAQEAALNQPGSIQLGGENSPADQQGHTGQVINQHKVLDSLLHSAPSGSPTVGESKLHHAEGPFTAELPAHQSIEQKPASEDDADGIIFDLYDDEAADSDSAKLSPLEEGVFHKLGESAEPEHGQGAETPGMPGNETGSSHEHAHGLKQVDYGNPQSAERLDSSQLRSKRAQICVTCGRAREHNRPTCPACGTHFDEGFI